MNRLLGFLLGSALALAASAVGGLAVSSVFPPRSLPAGTALLLEDAKGAVIWQTGEGRLPGVGELSKAAYVVFALPQGRRFRYGVAGGASRLDALRVRIGRETYTLGTLLKNRHVAIGKGGSLVAVPGKTPGAQAPTAPAKP